ncbi:MAG: hypothetical protein H7Y00_11860 [Fimbriimonadaceae bacterium]|nr:hypothetical protein [Chitinophagales bacterium]
MFKYTAANLKKVETLLNEAGYLLRYEKGNFIAGYCILETRKVIVINKYFDIDARTNSLLEIISRLPIDENNLSESSREFMHQYNIIALNPV